MKYQKIHFFLITLLLSTVLQSDDKYFPGSKWDSVSPESQGVEAAKVNKLIEMSFNDDATLGVVVIKNGKIIGEKYAANYDLDSHGTSWSMAKSYYAALIGIAIELGEIQSLDDPVAKYLDYYNDQRSSITIRDL